MRDLRVYVAPVASGARGERAAFYSRRADGPYYLWFYAEGAGRWRYSRVRLNGLALRMLSIAPWDSVPNALRERLGEHYLE
jgi:hypothetical protein